MNANWQAFHSDAQGDPWAQPNLRLRVGEHLVDVGALRIVTRPSHPRLTGKAAAVLVELARNAGDTVTRDTLLEHVWKDRVTTPDVLTQAIKELRRAFADDGKPPRYIETIPRVGYRLLVAVALVEGGDTAIVPEAAGVLPADNDALLDSGDTGLDAAELLRSDESPPVRRARGPWLIVIAVVLAAIAIAIAIALLRTGISPTGGTPTWQATELRAITSDPGAETRARISPDGTRVAFSQFDAASGFNRIMMRSVGQSKSVLLTTSTNAAEEVPAWSPDGSRIAFERLDHDRCEVYVASTIGGAEVEVGMCRDFIVNYFDWTPDGEALITSERLNGTPGNMVLERWDLASGIRKPLEYAHTADDQDLEAHYSPDHRWIAFRRGLAPNSDLYAMHADGSGVRQLTHLSSRIRGLTWTPDSSAVIFSSNHDGRFALYVVDKDSTQIHALNVTPAMYPDAANKAELVVYEIPRTNNRLARVPLKPEQAVPELLAKSTGSDSAPAVSPNGDRLVFVSDRSGVQQLWLYDFSTQQAAALTDYRDGVLVNPSWNAAGTRVLLTVRRTDGANHGANLVEIDLATRRERIVSRPGDVVLNGSYGPDPDSYVLVIGASARHNQLVFLEFAGSDKQRQTTLDGGVENMELDPVARMVYYTKSADLGLLRRDLIGGPKQVLTPLVTSSLIDGWRVVDGRIWYVTGVYTKPTAVHEFDPATGIDTRIGNLDTELRDVSFSVMPSRQQMIIVPVGDEDTDVGAFHLSHDGPPASR